MFYFLLKNEQAGAQEELLLCILTGARYGYRKYAPLFSRCSFQKRSQSTISRPAHCVLLSVWASGEKTEFFGMLLRKRERAIRIVYSIILGVRARTASAFLLLILQKKTTTWLQYEDENSSAWNHIIKPQRRRPPRRRTRKVLSLWHTRGSASRTSYITCRIMA